MTINTTDTFVDASECGEHTLCYEGCTGKSSCPYYQKFAAAAMADAEMARIEALADRRLFHECGCPTDPQHPGCRYCL